jgi:predicted GTPase
MGYCGNGKTSLFNNLCDTKYSTGSSLGSLTRDIAYEDVIYKPKLFRIYDTPGSDS